MNQYYKDCKGNIRFESTLKVSSDRLREYRKRFSYIFIKQVGVVLPFRVADYFKPKFMDGILCTKAVESGKLVISRGIYRNWLRNFIKQGGYNDQYSPANC